MPSPLRWGIVSAGKISHDFCVALSTLPFDEHQMTAVAARDQKRAEEFSKKHEIPKAFGSYEELAECPDVDIVYVGALNPQHFEICMLMLEHGKHILCEKPLCMNHKQAKKLIQYAEIKKLFLMEAVWSRFFPAYQYVRKQIASGVLGEIQEVDVQFGFEIEQVDRVKQNNLGGGTILDLGIYTIQVSQWAFQEPPQKIVAKGTLNENGVDIDVETELIYSGNRKSKMRTSALGELDNKAVIKGTKGQITLLQFWCPTKLIDIDGQEKEWVLPKGKHATNYTNSEGLRYEAEAARVCILEGKLQNEHVTHNDSLLFAQIEDEIRKQVGVVYPEDK
ncbi:trans-1,2-dihydrobenzene-1,2-diol dehydrogenase [Stomoxys calcitrans]|uniref:Trans-1,2-dihydrobenzene-1,2-diol dehydrogenase n=1 Tax=Stomoxys calcitrans TaxID=35570 RepID=A0A1I8NNZ7_STOCA|nr:trans-1,2-dihydrobenzene-1,2-diol dehydrogenase [Stomoxys calcitrans]XP_059221349.1 trans-1,2-dihydrobenzene-1,2-diol dehydrogenase [Stomoxys calcitrans]